MTEEKTKAEIIAEIEATEQAIKDAFTKHELDSVPPHDFYRAVMWTECMSCSNRMVDVGDCATCQPLKQFLHENRCRHDKPDLSGLKQCVECGKYPWKSDYVLTREERAKLPKKVA